MKEMPRDRNKKNSKSIKSKTNSNKKNMSQN